MPFIEAGELRTHYALTGEKESVLLLSNSLGTDFPCGIRKRQRCSEIFASISQPSPSLRFFAAESFRTTSLGKGTLFNR
jgi:hypothetical protein